MKPYNLKTKIFLDGGDPNETYEAKKLLSFLDGQTTNPALISKNLAARDDPKRFQNFSEEELYAYYLSVAKEIMAISPDGSISVEVHAEQLTKAGQMLRQARQILT